MKRKLAFNFALSLTVIASLLVSGCDKKEESGTESISSQSVVVVDKPDMTSVNDYYFSNKAPLEPSVFVKLPVTAIKPGSWVKELLERQRDGLTGHLGEISAWLQKTDNAWLAEDGKGTWGWEEVPYWLKGFANLGYILDDQKIIDEAKIWIEAALSSQRENGDFGPDQRHSSGKRDYWANMVMLFCLQSYYEYSQDERVLDLMTNYFKHQLEVADEDMLSEYWDRMRGGDNIYSIYWLYNRTGEQWLLDVAKHIHENTANWKMENDLPNWHNVNIAEAFGEPATYYMQTRDKSDLQAAYNNFDKIREIYGQVPGGMWGGDENSRKGYDDPRQGVETCGLVEHMLSDELLFRINGDIFWLDHCEEVAFNTYTAAVTEDFKALRYITAPNMVLSDDENHHPGIDNGGPFLMMNPFSSRCCQHNHSHGWPYYAEHLWYATPDNGACAAMFCSSTAKIKVGDGTEVTFVESSNYPFEEDINITVNTPKMVEFPLYLRVPNWCEGASISVNGNKVEVKPVGGKLVKIVRKWGNGDIVKLNLPMSITVKKWEKNHNSVSVNYGPMTLSLKIKEHYEKRDSSATAIWDSKWQKGADPSKWPSYEIFPDSAWNYGLVLDQADPASSFTVKKKAWPASDYPFNLDSVPLEVTAKAKRIPNWTIDRYGLCGQLQDSPVLSDEPLETVTLVPMGAARLRITAFPTIGEGPDANRWQAEEIPPVRASACFEGDDIMAVKDGVVPTDSDQEVSRHSWWPLKGGSQWLEMDLDGQEQEISSVSVYWFDDAGKGECRVPESWKLLYRNDAGSWNEVTGAVEFGNTSGVFNTVKFDQVKTDSIRIEAQLQKDFSGGIYEIKVN